MAITKVSAPAKVLLFGEHAVVYGSACVAAALNDLRLYVSIDAVNPRCTDITATADAPTAAAKTLTLVFRDLVSAADGKPLQRSFVLASLQAIATDLPDDAHYLPRSSDTVLQRVDAMLAHESEDDAKALRPAIFLCVAVLRSSWVSLAVPCSVDSSSTTSNSDNGSARSESATVATTASLTIEVSATERFPIGAGLGSSAAFSVALAGALLLFQRQSSQRSDSAASPSLSPPASKPLDEPTLARINAFAFAAEVILHGTPSGVDNTVATYGGALMFTKLPAPAFTRIASDLNAFRFLLVNTRVARSTKQQVANVRARLESDRASVEQHFSEIDAIARAFVARSEQRALTEQELAHQLARNHALLNALGVGHEAIERVAAVASTFGATTKLTGAGGGGCTLTLLPAELDAAALQQLLRALEVSGFECFVSAVGGAGVQLEA